MAGAAETVRESKKQVVICSAVRTPVGSFNGALSDVPAHTLGATVISEALKRASVAKEAVDEVIMGHVLTAGQGQNPARRAAIDAGLSTDVPAHCINMVCGSGLKSVHSGYQSIMTGENSVVVTGGQENMSKAPHCSNLRTGTKMGAVNFVDTVINDGLTCAFNDYHMGITAENIAEKFSLTRTEQDEFSLQSQLKAEKSQNDGLFDKEITPVVIKTRKGEVVVDRDEYIKKGCVMEGFAKLRPCFKKDGTVTAGNASGINDGAAAVVLMDSEEASAKGVTPLARIVSFGEAGVDPSVMGTGPIPATKKALKNANWQLSDVDLFEFNEAFAAQSLAVVKDLGVDPSKVNVNGGSISIGHPIGASGCRILVTLLHAMEQRNAKKGVASLCIGGGMGIAICVERDL
eukprot:Nk52_evm7s281 gene=Nk52_evmTU7s281